MRFVFLIILSLFFSNLTFAALPKPKSSPDLQQMNPQEIKTLREGLGLNQTEFAKLTNSHPGLVSRWETGEAKPYQRALEALHVLKKMRPTRPDLVLPSSSSLITMSPSEIRELRQNLGLSQTQLGKRIGSNRSQINNWESGSSKPKYESLKALHELKKMPEIPKLLEMEPSEIRLIRERLDLSRSEFAKKTNSTEAAVRHWEMGNAKPGHQSLMLLHDLSKMPPLAKISSVSPLEILEIRQKLRLSQADLAKLINSHQTSVTGWETGKSKPNRQALEVLHELKKLHQVGELSNSEIKLIREKLGLANRKPRSRNDLSLPELPELSAAEIKDIRVGLGLSQEEFGKRTGSSRSVVNSWEHGFSKPNRQWLSAIYNLKKHPKLPSLPMLAEMNPSEIRALREGLRLSRAEFAIRVHSTKAIIKNWEDGSSKPNRQSLEALYELKKLPQLPPLPPVPELLPSEIKALREGLRLGRAEFANKIQSTTNLVYNWELGKTKPNRQSLEALHDLKKEIDFPLDRIDALAGEMCKKVNDRSIETPDP